MRFVSCIILLLASFYRISTAAEPVAEQPTIVNTSGGSRISGLLLLDRPLSVRPEKGAPQQLDVAAIKSIIFGQRADPNQENEALVALGDMQSDQFEVREKALVRLRALGRAAIKPLKKATTSPDAEVATRARALLSELTLQNAAAALGDQITTQDGKVVTGELSPAEFTLRSRWGILKLPCSCLESMEFLKAGDVNVATLVQANSAVIQVQPRPASSLDAAAERWEVDDAQRIAAPVGKTLSGLNALTMDRAPNADPNAPAEKRMIPINAGDRLEDVYSPWGALLRVAPNTTIEAVNAQLVGASGNFAAQSKSDVVVHFVMPGTYKAKSGEMRAGGVTVIGAAIKAAPRFTIGLAVYDRAGRQLAEVYNTGLSEDLLGPGVNAAEFLGVRSKIPIVRARFFRAGDARGQELIIDDIVFDRIVSVDRPPDIACVWLASGERLAGQVKAAALDKGMELEPEFLFKQQSTFLQIPIDEIDRYEPARQGAALTNATPGKDPAPKPKRVSLGTPHGVLLQSGDSFRAFLVKIDEKDARFMLPGGAELKLPRTTLRKIDLAPAVAEPGELSPPITVAEGEKTGVDFRRRDEGKKPEGEKPPEAKPPEAKPPEAKPPEVKPKKNDPLQNTQELQPMPDVKILEADMFSGDLTIEDDNGPWTIGLAPVKTLVFPADPNAKKSAPKFRDWILTLREGSRFEIVLTGITPDSISAEMAGGAVSLPGHVVDSIHRQKR